MAETYLKFYTQGLVDVYSAGLESKGLHVLAQTVMAEDGLDISRHSSDHVKQWKGVQFDYLLSLCGDLEASVLELFPKTQCITWDFEDPDNTSTLEHARINTFREVRESIKAQIIKFIGEKLAEHIKMNAQA